MTSETTKTEAVPAVGFTPYVQSRWKQCPRCASPAPERHPAVQCEGEVELCTHEFHLQRTNMNKPEYIEAVLAKRAALAKALGEDR